MVDPVLTTTTPRGQTDALQSHVWAAPAVGQSMRPARWIRNVSAIEVLGDSTHTP